MQMHEDVMEFASKYPSQELKAFNFHPCSLRCALRSNWLQMFDIFVVFNTR